MRRLSLLSVSAVAFTLAACGGRDDSTNLVVDQNAAQPAENAMAGDPSNPFADAEMQMHERMTAAAGANASETWARKMIEHHRGGIAMSEILLARGGDQAFLEKARMTADQQRRDIAELERMLSAGLSGGSGPANPFAQSESRMHDRMMAARGASAQETWARKMIEHHRGAIQMSEILLGQNPPAQLREMARRTIDQQRRDIQDLERLLQGAPAAEGSRTEAPAPPRPNETAPPAPRRPAPAEKAKQEPEDPHAGHDMGNMSHD